MDFELAVVVSAVTVQQGPREAGTLGEWCAEADMQTFVPRRSDSLTTSSRLAKNVKLWQGTHHGRPGRLHHLPREYERLRRAQHSVGNCLPLSSGPSGVWRWSVLSRTILVTLVS